MDVEYQSGELLFEWDSEKARINKLKHHVSFETAANVFFDENRIEKLDEDHSDDEDRWKVLGKVDTVLFVIYTDRGDRTRIIRQDAPTKTKGENTMATVTYILR